MSTPKGLLRPVLTCYHNSLQKWPRRRQQQQQHAVDASLRGLGFPINDRGNKVRVVVGVVGVKHMNEDKFKRESEGGLG